MTSDRELENWIEESRSNRRHLKVGVGVFTLLSVLVTLANRSVGGVMFFIVALTAIVGVWIMSNRITDWETQLARRRHTATREHGVAR
ncbi:MAG: hypothetical protein ABI867_24085 [Kofleriaceae bacterium]